MNLLPMKYNILKQVHISRLVVLLIILTAGAESILAESLKIRSFSPEPFDLSASTNPVLDLNGVAGALLKISFDKNPAEVKIEGNLIQQSFDGSETLAYISSGTKTIVIKTKGCPPLKLNFSDYGVYRLLSKQVYNLSLQLESESSPSSQSTYSAPNIHELLNDSEGDPIDRIVDEANSLYANGKVADAIPLLEKAASLGHPDALLSLGLLYEKGVGTKGNWILKPNASKAFINVQASAQQGFSPAQNVLYRYYLTGVGVDVDKTRAELWKTLYDKAQDNQGSEQGNNTVFTSVEQKPEYPGGEKKLMKDLVRNLNYPVYASENGIQGKVILNFVVRKDGTIGEIKVLKTSLYYIKDRTADDGKVVSERIALPEGDKEMEQAAIDAVRQLDNFYPGKMNGVPVNVWYTLPVKFTLMGS